MKNLTGIAHQVLQMDDENRRLRAEVQRLQEIKKKYDALLNDSIKHGEIMMSHLLTGALNGAFTRK